MKKLMKILSLSLALIMVLGACSKGREEKPTEDTGNTTVDSSEQQTTEGTEATEEKKAFKEGKDLLSMSQEQINALDEEELKLGMRRLLLKTN